MRLNPTPSPSPTSQGGEQAKPHSLGPSEELVVGETYHVARKPLGHSKTV